MAETKPKRARAPRKSRAKKAPAKKPAPAPAPVVEPVVEAAPVVDETPVVVEVVPPTRRSIKAHLNASHKGLLRAAEAAMQAAREGRYMEAHDLLTDAKLAAASAHIAAGMLT